MNNTVIYKPDILEVVNRFGMRRKGEFYYCPIHSDSSTPNLHITPRKGVWFCFVCGKGGDSYDLIGNIIVGKHYDRRNKNHFKKVIEYLKNENYRKVEYSLEEEPLKLNISIKEYLYSRTKPLSKISIEYLLHRKIYNPELYLLREDIIDGIPYITIPIVYNNRVIHVKRRRNDLCKNIDLDKHKRYKNFPGSDGSLPHKLYNKKDKKILFFEDSISAISANQFGFPSAALPHGNSIQRSSRKLYKKMFDDKKLIIIPDNDEAGTVMVENFKNILNNLVVCRVPDKYKDFNEFLCDDEQAALKFIKEVYRNG